MNIYFYCKPQGQGRKPAYQFNLIYLAEGLRELGVPFQSNIDYWDQGNGQFLFEASSDTAWQEYDVVIVSSIWQDYGGQFPAELLAPSVKAKRILVDTFDGWLTSTHRPEASAFDLILKQKVRHAHYPHPHTYPWTFGFGRAISAFFDAAPEFESRQPGILVNYRHMHPFRRLAAERILPQLIQKYPEESTQEQKAHNLASSAAFTSPYHQAVYRQSGYRHHPDYLQRIASHQFCAAFGGLISPRGFWAQPGLGYRLAPYLYPGLADGRLVRLSNQIGLQTKHAFRIHQWDSWRLWESWAGGSIPLHVDLEKYGVAMPVMPENWKHYIGFDMENPQDDIDRFLALTPEESKQIARAGQKWALEHYSPRSVASRLLDLMNTL